MCKTHKRFLDDAHPIQYEIELKPKVHLHCDTDPNKKIDEDKGNIKWYPICHEKINPKSTSAKPQKYVYFKLEREPTLSLLHFKNALLRYGFGIQKPGETRREDDKPKKIKHENHKKDPRGGSFGGPTVCCAKDDIWINVNNEYYLCHKLLYKMLDLAANPTVKVESADFEIKPMDTCVI